MSKTAGKGDTQVPRDQGSGVLICSGFLALTLSFLIAPATGQHLQDSAALGGFFAVVGGLQLLWPIVALRSLSRPLLFSAALVAAILALWTFAGLPPLRPETETWGWGQMGFPHAIAGFYGVLLAGMLVYVLTRPLPDAIRLRDFSPGLLAFMTPVLVLALDALTIGHT